MRISRAGIDFEKVKELDSLLIHKGYAIEIALTNFHDGYLYWVEMRGKGWSWYKMNIWWQLFRYKIIWDSLWRYHGLVVGIFGHVGTEGIVRSGLYGKEELVGYEPTVQGLINKSVDLEIAKLKNWHLRIDRYKLGEENDVTYDELLNQYYSPGRCLITRDLGDGKYITWCPWYNFLFKKKNPLNGMKNNGIWLYNLADRLTDLWKKIIMKR